MSDLLLDAFNDDFLSRMWCGDITIDRHTTWYEHTPVSAADTADKTQLLVGGDASAS